MRGSYHNTTMAEGAEFRRYEKAAGSQEKKILAFFQQNDGQRFTPSEIHGALFLAHTPITSVRRAMTNLTTEGKLTKTDKQIHKGPYGRPEYLWTLAKEPAPGEQLKMFN